MPSPYCNRPGRRESKCAFAPPRGTFVISPVSSLPLLGAAYVCVCVCIRCMFAPRPTIVACPSFFGGITSELLANSANITQVTLVCILASLCRYSRAGFVWTQIRKLLPACGPCWKHASSGQRRRSKVRSPALPPPWAMASETRHEEFSQHSLPERFDVRLGLRGM